LSECAQKNHGTWDREFSGGRFHQGLQRSLVDWLECQLLLSLARRESCYGPQCNARHKSDGNDLEVGFHFRRNYFPPRCSQPEMRKPNEKITACSAGAIGSAHTAPLPNSSIAN